MTIVEPEGRSNVTLRNNPPTVENTPKTPESNSKLLNLNVHWYAEAAGVTIMAKTRIAPIAFNDTEIVIDTRMRKV